MSVAKKGLATAAGTIMLLNIFGKVFGLIRERTIGVIFGTSNLTDAFLVANTIPTIAFFSIGGALSTALIPIYKKYLVQKGQQEADLLVSAVLNVSVILLAIISLIGIIFAPQITKLMAPGFDQETLMLATNLSRMLFPTILFMSLGVLMSGILNSRGHFTLPAALPLVQSLVLIIFAYTLSEQFGIFSLAIGTLVGVVIQPLLQIPALARGNLKYSLVLDWHNSEVRKVFSLLFPVIVGTAVVQLYLAISRIIGSGLPAGSIASLNFAYLLVQLPMGIFVSAIATVIFPLMAEQATKADSKSMAHTVFTGMRTMALLIIPASFGLLALREPIVKLIYQSGAFDARATEFTSFALLFFSIGLLGFSLPYIVNRAYYAFQDTLTPLKVSVISIIINVILSLLLLPILGHGGLALSVSMAASFYSFSLIWFLKKHIPEISLRKIVKSFAQITLAGGIMYAVIIGLSDFLEAIINVDNKLGQALFVSTNALVGVFVYILVVFVLKLEEGKIAWDIISRKLKIKSKIR